MGVNGIYGLSGSGIDVESMVKVGMLTQQKQYDKLQQSYTKNEWQKQAYNDLYSSIQTFNNSTLSPYKMQSVMNAKSASTTSDAISVTANGDAPILNHKVQVNSLSTNAYLVSTNSLKRYNSSANSANGDQTSLKLADVLFQGLRENKSTGSKMYNVNALAPVESSTEDEEENTSGLNLHKPGEAAFQFQISDGSSTKTIKYTYNQLYNGKSFNDLVTDINSLGLNVRASYDSVNDSFSFYNKEGGSANGISFKFATDSTNEATKTAATNAKYFFQNLQMYQSLDGQLLDTNGDVVTDETKGTNYYGYSTVDAPASIATKNPVTDFNGNTANWTTSLESLMFKDVELYTEEVDGEYVDRVRYSDSEDAEYDNYEYSGINSADAALNFTIGDQSFSYSYYDIVGTGFSMQNLVDDIIEKTGFNAEIDDDGYLKINSGDEIGDDQVISITSQNDLTSRFLNRLGFTDTTADTDLTFTTGETINASGSSANGSSNYGVYGTSGEAIIDGVTYNDISNNKVTAAGVTYTLLNTTESAATVNVTQDTQSVIDKVKSFVEDYNKILSSLYEKYDEKQYKDYKPLTESQKEQMKDEQIEKWEEKAKSGILYHDETISKIIYSMREAISTPVDGINGKYNSAYSLGIKTTGTKGQLTLDEDKLKQALTDDPDSVYNVFGRLDPKDDSDGNGVAQRIGDVLTSGMKSIRERAGTDDSVNDDSDLGQLMRNLQTRMSDFRKLMNSFETKLYKKYDAMEVALSRLGMQLGYITGGQ
ncbi:MAG: flagellar filament capping protein FliD [Selenomonadaceae bacterium]|nr:flagellar filament capping protein FliD [Selenomonadaceae bacterium]